jgi:hypothetical protein
VTPPGFVLPGIDVQKRVNRILSLMQYALRPRRDDQLAVDHGGGQRRCRPGAHAVRRRLHGGSLMLDWERYRLEGEWDLEIRYSHIKLESLDSTSSGVEGKALARSLGVWGRYRAPTGKTVFDRPLRYVLEVAGSNYYGDTGDALGFDRLLSLGVGIEFDTSKYDMIIARTRLVLRRLIGRDVEGLSLGIAVSF